MKVLIYRVRLSHLRNSEYVTFVSQLVAIFLKFSAEGLHLKKSFDRVLAMIPELEKVRAQELSSVYSNLIHQLEVERSQIFTAFVKQVSNFEKSGLKSFVPYFEIIDRLLDKHGRDIASVGQNAKTKKLNDFLSDVNASDEIRAAITALGLTLFIEELGTANTEFNSKYVLRTETDAEVEVVDAHAIRTESDKVLTAFFDAFEFCSTEYEDIDYKTPAAKLNEHITHYRTELKARETRRVNGKDTTVEAPIAAKA